MADRSLDDIRFALSPSFAPEALPALDANKAWSRGLDGSEYLPGVIGLNNLKATDYAGVVLQALMRVTPLRNFFLVKANWAHCASPVARAPRAAAPP